MEMKLKMKMKSAALALAALFCASMSGCAGSTAAQGADGKAAGDNKPPVFADAKNALYVSAPAVPDSVDSLLSRLGWGAGRFSSELRKEVVFQLNRKGVPTVEDSAAAKSFLAIGIGEYAEGGGSPSRYVGSARLRTPSGERLLTFAKAAVRAEAPERPDPTVDNIRLIAEAVVSDAAKSPQKPAARKSKKTEYNPQLIMLF
jgi:hypothetical protein